MKDAVVVYIDSDPANPVAIFFKQNFPGGKTAAQAASDFAGGLSGTGGFIPSTSSEARLDDYTLITGTDVNL